MATSHRLSVLAILLIPVMMTEFYLSLLEYPPPHHV
jgi:hypothetical protein